MGEPGTREGRIGGLRFAIPRPPDEVASVFRHPPCRDFTDGPNLNEVRQPANTVRLDSDTDDSSDLQQLLKPVSASRAPVRNQVVESGAWER